VQPAARPATRVVLAMISSICVTLINNALDTSPTVTLIGAALAAAVPALITAGGPHGVALGVIGESYPDAEARLQSAGLNITREDVESIEPPETVVEQDPAAGTRVDEGTTITLSVSVEAPGELTVPNVTGLTEAEATLRLEELGFEVSVVPQDVTDESQVGVVLAQEPPGETEANPRDTVTITVGQLAS
jgi:eukaryotic-like serine/threonine-protein kinase